MMTKVLRSLLAGIAACASAAGMAQFGALTRVNSETVNGPSLVGCQPLAISPDGETVYYSHPTLGLFRRRFSVISRFDLDVGRAKVAGDLIAYTLRSDRHLYLSRLGGSQQVFETRLLSAKADGTPINAPVEEFDLAPDGRYAVFTTKATNLGPQSNPPVSHAYLKDTTGGMWLSRQSVNEGKPLTRGVRAPRYVEGFSVAFLGDGSEVDSRVPSGSHMMLSRRGGANLSLIGQHLDGSYPDVTTYDFNYYGWVYQTNVAYPGRPAGIYHTRRSQEHTPLALRNSSILQLVGISSDDRYLSVVTDDPRIFVGDNNGVADLVHIDTHTGVGICMSQSQGRLLGNRPSSGTTTHPPLLAKNALAVLFASESTGWYGFDQPNTLDLFHAYRPPEPTAYVLLRQTRIAREDNPAVRILTRDGALYPAQDHASDFVFVDAADFNGDGSQDWLMFNPPNRRFWVRLVDGTRVRVPWAGMRSIDPGWTVCGAGDFNRDGTPDVVVQRDSDKRVGGWYGVKRNMNTIEWGTWFWIGPINPNYTLVGCADIKWDGYADLVVRGPDGDIGSYHTYFGSIVGYQRLAKVNQGYVGATHVLGSPRTDLVFAESVESSHAGGGAVWALDWSAPRPAWLRFPQPVPDRYYTALAATSR